MLNFMYVQRIVNGNPEVLPINPTHLLYLGDMWICTLGHVGSSNRCGGDSLERVPMTHTLVNGALVHPSQSGRYAEGYMALG